MKHLAFLLEGRFKKNLTLGLLAFSFLLLSALGLQLYISKATGINLDGEMSILKCIQKDKNKIHMNLTNSLGVSFDVNWVARTKSDCLNPYFPSIHIATNSPHNAWLQIVYSDSVNPVWQKFIDAESPDKINSKFPFYTIEQDFFDAPVWGYSVFFKEVSHWEGHAFALQIDYTTKTIKSLGGVIWGFEISGIFPTALPPKVLDEKAWLIAWDLVKEKLPGFKLD